VIRKCSARIIRKIAINKWLTRDARKRRPMSFQEELNSRAVIELVEQNQFDHRTMEILRSWLSAVLADV
jgi:hypothetical protein